MDCGLTYFEIDILSTDEQTLNGLTNLYRIGMKCSLSFNIGKKRFGRLFTEIINFFNKKNNPVYQIYGQHYFENMCSPNQYCSVY